MRTLRAHRLKGCATNGARRFLHLGVQVFTLCLIPMLAASLWAQEDLDKAQEKLKLQGMIKAKIEAEMAAAKAQAAFGVLGDVVKGAPYWAEAITESRQTLGDGNRIR